MQSFVRIIIVFVWFRTYLFEQIVSILYGSQNIVVCGMVLILNSKNKLWRDFLLSDPPSRLGDTVYRYRNYQVASRWAPRSLRANPNTVLNSSDEADLEYLLPIKYSVIYNVTSNECFAGNGQIPERSDTSEYIKRIYKGSVSLR